MIHIFIYTDFAPKKLSILNTLLWYRETELSLKNLPNCDEKIYKQNLLENIRYLSKRYVGELCFSWTTTNKLLKTTSKVLAMVLKKTGCPQHVQDLFLTEDNLVDMEKELKSCNVKNYFQKMRYEDVKNVATSKKILVV